MSSKSTILAFLAKMLLGRRIAGWHILSVRSVNEHTGYCTFKCRCVCGKIEEVPQKSLIAGTMPSCGCLQALFAQLWRLRAGHNLPERPLFVKEHTTWRNIVQRCHNPNHRDYYNYGLRGIAVCDRWRESFDAMLEDVGPAPSMDHSLDRIDPDGNYEPGNCRWVGWRDQLRSRGDIARIEWNGIKLTFSEWSDLTGIPTDTLRWRIYRLKWEVFEALTTPWGTKQKPRERSVKPPDHALQEVLPQAPTRQEPPGKKPGGRKATWPPQVRHHKQRNLARVFFQGRWHYLGPWGSQEATAAYEHFILKHARAEITSDPSAFVPNWTI